MWALASSQQTGVNRLVSSETCRLNKPLADLEEGYGIRDSSGGTSYTIAFYCTTD